MILNVWTLYVITESWVYNFENLFVFFELFVITVKAEKHESQKNETERRTCGSSRSRNSCVGYYNPRNKHWESSPRVPMNLSHWIHLVWGKW